MLTMRPEIPGKCAPWHASYTWYLTHPPWLMQRLVVGSLHLPSSTATTIVVPEGGIPMIYMHMQGQYIHYKMLGACCPVTDGMAADASLAEGRLLCSSFPPAMRGPFIRPLEPLPCFVALAASPRQPLSRVVPGCLPPPRFAARCASCYPQSIPSELASHRPPLCLSGCIPALNSIVSLPPRLHTTLTTRLAIRHY